MNQGYETVIRNTPWLWASTTLTPDDLEEIYHARGIDATLGNIIYMEEQGSVLYSSRGLFQAPIQITP